MNSTRPRDAADIAGLAAAMLLVIVAGGTIVIALSANLPAAFGYLPSLGLAETGFEAFRDLVHTPKIGWSMMLSLWTALASTALSYLLAMALLGVVFASRQYGGAAAVVGNALLAVPHTAVALAAAFLIAPSGLLTRLASGIFGFDGPPSFSAPGDPAGFSLILGLTLKETPFLFVLGLTALRSLAARDLMDQARSLGYSSYRSFVLVVAPLVHRQVKIGTFIVLAFGVGATEQALILGPTIGPPLSVRLAEWFQDPDLAKRTTLAAGSLVLVGLVGAALLAWQAMLWLAGVFLRRRAMSGQRKGILEHGLFIGAWTGFGAAAFAILGLAVLAFSSFAGPWRFPALLPDSLSMSVWQSQATLFATPLANTIVIAAIVSSVALTSALLALETTRTRPALRTLLTILLLGALIIPEPSLVFGLSIVMIALRVDATIFAVVWAHLLFALPYAWLLLTSADRAIDPRPIFAARTLGAGPLETFLRIRLPLLAPALLTAGFLAAIISVGLYLPTLVAGAGRIGTLTTEGVAMAQGDRRVAGAFSLLLTLVPLLLLGLAAATRRLFANSGITP